MVQAVPLELQWRLAPVSLSAATWKCWASGLGDQDTAMVPPSSHGASTATSRGAQGAEGEQRGQVVSLLLSGLVRSWKSCRSPGIFL